MSKLIIYLAMSFLASVFSSAHAQVMAMVTLVPEHRWVEIKNPEPIRHRNSSFSFGDVCALKVGNLLTVVGSVDRQMLVRYSAPGDVFGAACPDGVLFQLSRQDFEAMTGRMTKVIEGMNRLKASP